MKLKVGFARSTSLASIFVCPPEMDQESRFTVKTVHAWPHNFEVFRPTFECRMWRFGNSLQRFAPNVPTFRQNVRANLTNFIQDLFLAREVFKRRFQDDRGQPLLAWQSSKFELECSWINMPLRVLDVRRKAKRFISASNLNELKEKGKTRYT